MTISSPNTIDTTLAQDGQADGSFTMLRMRTVVDSLSGLASSTQTGSYTLVLADRGTRIRYNSASGGTFTVPPNASVAYDVDTVILFCQVGAGQLTLLGGSGVTLRTPSSLTTRAQWSSIGIHQDAANVWVVSGDLT